jgi:hypothetical protein
LGDLLELVIGQLSLPSDLLPTLRQIDANFALVATIAPLARRLAV